VQGVFIPSAGHHTLHLGLVNAKEMQSSDVQNFAIKHHLLSAPLLKSLEPIAEDCENHSSQMTEIASKFICNPIPRVVAILFHVDVEIASDWVTKFIGEYVIDQIVVVSGNLEFLATFEKHWGNYFEVTPIGVGGKEYLPIDVLCSILDAEGIRIEDVVWISKIGPPTEIQNLIRAKKSY
jgi:hypothetical protein